MVANDVERIDRIEIEHLALWMDERDLPGAGEPLRAEFISGGASNEIFRLERGG